MSRLSTDQVSKRLSEYLLKGWAMLEDVCPNPSCDVPLMENRDGKVICVRCDISSETPAPQTPFNAFFDQSARNPPKELLEETSQPQSQPQPQSQSQSQSQTTQKPVQEDLPETPSQPKLKSRTNEISSLLGRKMLQGWTLLQESCPASTCPGVPLVRDKERKMFCVSCEAVYIKPEDYNPTKHQIVSNSSQPQNSEGSSKNVKEEASQPKEPENLETKLSSQQNLPSQSRFESAPQLKSEESPTTTNPFPVNSSKPSRSPREEQQAEKRPRNDIPKFHYDYDEAETFFQESSSTLLTREDEIVNRALEVLLKKLESTTNSLSNSHDPRVSITLCELISSSADAIKHLKGLK